MDSAVEAEVEANIETVVYSQRRTRGWNFRDGGEREEPDPFESLCLHGYGIAVVIWLFLTCLPFHLFVAGAGFWYAFGAGILAVAATPALVGGLPESCPKCAPAASDDSRPSDDAASECSSNHPAEF